MNEYDAHGFINNLATGEHSGGIGYVIVRDEPGSNDRGLGNRHFFFGGGDHPGGYLNAQSNGINFFQIISVPKGLLNEDDGVFDDTDEIYVVADFVDGDSGVRRRTPTWSPAPFSQLVAHNSAYMILFHHCPAQ